MRRRSPFPPLLLVSFILFTLASSEPIFAQDDFVHVRLLRDAGPQTIVVSSTSPLRLYTVGIENPISQVPANEKITLTTSNERVYLTSREGGIYATNLVIAQTDNADLTIEVADGDQRTSARTYRGAFQIEVEKGPRNRLKIVNAVPLEDYVVSVLSSEFGFSEIEGAKALAVCIRTLALKSLTSQNEPNFAVADDESWQVYRGTGPITPTAVQATQETIGQVIVHNGKLIDAVYFASSGGATANNEDVWNSSNNEPYLRGKSDAYDSTSPHHSWTSRVPRSQLLRHLSDVYNNQIASISVASVNRQDNRVQTMRLNTQNNQEVIISGSEFREKVTARFGRESLKSTMFTLEEQSNRYVFNGKGFGHGVGLNQWGARELSRRGQLYDEIIAFYYTDVEVQYFDMLGEQSFTYENIARSETLPEETPTTDIPIIDWNSPSSTGIAETEPPSNSSSSFPDVNTFSTAPSGSSTVPQSNEGRPSGRARLFGDGGEEPVEDSFGSQSLNRVEQNNELGQTDNKRRIHSDSKIVGWSKTVDPASSPPPDSVRTKTVRRKGW